MQIFTMNSAALTQQRTIFFAGASCTVHANSAALLQTLGEAATAHTAITGASTLTMQLVVNTEATLFGPAHYRGQHHIATASFGPANILVFDLLRRHISGTVTAEVAGDVLLWRERLLPLCIGIMGACIGLLPVHCACLSFGGEGILIAGESGAGKSTLSAELSRTNSGLSFEYIADDWTYITLHQEKMIAHGSGAPIKLLPDAIHHFPVLSHSRTQVSMNGELAYEVHPTQTFGAKVQHQCTPHWLFFLERTDEPGIAFTPLRREDAYEYILKNAERMPTQMTEATARRAHMMHAVAGLPCWTLRYGGSPAFAAQQLREFVTTLRRECA